MIRKWNEGALAALAAIRGRVQDDGRIFLSELVSGLVLDTSPNVSLLGRVLRDRNFFMGTGQVRATRRQTPNEAENSNPYDFFPLAIERFAEQENVRTVGERHIAKLLVEIGFQNRFGALGLNPDLVYKEVRRLEIGPELSDDELKGWHGLIDTNVVLKTRPPIWDIDWREVSGRKTGSITVWISTVTLHELDTIPLHHRENRIRDKSRRVAIWFNERVKTKDFHEIPIADGVRFKFWKASVAVTPDTQILDSANALRDKGVNLTIITHDMDLRLRALDEEFEVADLPSHLLVDPTAQPVP